MRKCSYNCPNEALKDKGQAPWERLCQSCHDLRKAKQQASRAQPKCQCGNCLPLDANLCRGCQAIEAEAEFL